MTRVLFVCLGNICRSPTAEAILRRKAPEIDVDSAGTSDWHVGNPPYGPAIGAGAKRGYDLGPLRARQVSVEDFRDFDLMLAMDENNLRQLRNISPEAATADIRLLLDFAPAISRRDVPDPYYTRDFAGTVSLLEAAVDGLVDAIRSNRA